MALTAAERVRRYREKLKNNPEKAEEIRKKNLERIKSKKKLVSQMTEQDKNEHLKVWREEKRKQRAQKSKKTVVTAGISNADVTAGTSNAESTSRQSKAQTSLCNKSELNINKQLKCIRRKYKILKQKYKSALKKNESLARAKETQKKRYYRLKESNLKIINHQQKIIEKLKAREELLELTLRRTYENCENRIEKQVLKRLIENSQPGKKNICCQIDGAQKFASG